MGSDIVPYMRLGPGAEFALLNKAGPGPLREVASTPDEISQFFSGLLNGLGTALVDVTEGVSVIADVGIAAGKTFAAGSQSWAGKLGASIQNEAGAWRANPVGQLQKTLRDFSFEEIG